MKTTTIDVIPYFYEGDNKTAETILKQSAAKFPLRLKDASEDAIRIRQGAIYKGAHYKVDVVCVTCGHEWGSTANSLIAYKAGCPECARQRCVQSAGKLRSPRATKEEIFQAQQMRKSGMSYQAIANELGRSRFSIACWCDPERKKKDNEKAAASNAIKKASGKALQLQRAYRQTPHGKANNIAKCHKRRSLEFHARDIVFLPEHKDADYQGFVSFDLWEDFVKGDKVAMELFSFTDADNDVRKRKEQQDKLAKISGEPYSLEHLVPLSRGGTHQPHNFANRALALNIQKNNKRVAADEELFLKRLFDIN